ncbi:hypothetical protein H0E87_031587, partial [Populus deltoides]
GASIHQRRLKKKCSSNRAGKSPITRLSLKPNLWWILGDKVKALDPLPHIGDAPHRRSSSDAALGLALSRYRSVWISQVPNVQSCSGLRKEHRPITLNE